MEFEGKYDEFVPKGLPSVVPEGISFGHKFESSESSLLGAIAADAVFNGATRLGRPYRPP
jgi:hypothetical protein